MRRIYSSRTDPAYIPGLSDVEEKPGELRTHPQGLLTYPVPFRHSG